MSGTHFVIVVIRLSCTGCQLVPAQTQAPLFRQNVSKVFSRLKSSNLPLFTRCCHYVGHLGTMVAIMSRSYPFREHDSHDLSFVWVMYIVFVCQRSPEGKVCVWGGRVGRENDLFCLQTPIITDNETGQAPHNRFCSLVPAISI